MVNRDILDVLVAVEADSPVAVVGIDGGGALATLQRRLARRGRRGQRRRAGGTVLQLK